MPILLADDSRTILSMTVDILKMEGFNRLITASNGDEAWEIYKFIRPPLMIVDWDMPCITGEELCRKIRANEAEKDRYTYIILLTARNRQEDIVQGLNSGADDYVTKPFNSDEFIARVNIGLRIIELQNRLKAQKEQIAMLANTDILTGTLNRRRTLERLNEETAKSSRKKSWISVCMCDIDHFKRINDAHGHPAGDEVLKGIAQTIKNSLRLYDIVGRYGGEEFLVILPDTSIQEAYHVAERLRKMIEVTSVRWEDRDIFSTISIGVTSAIPSGKYDAIELIRTSDIAMYSAKEKGRNRTESMEFKANSYEMEIPE